MIKDMIRSSGLRATKRRFRNVYQWIVGKILGYTPDDVLSFLLGGRKHNTKKYVDAQRDILVAGDFRVAQSLFDELIASKAVRDEMNRVRIRPMDGC